MRKGRSPDAKIRALAERHHAIVSRREALAAGLSPSAIGRRVEAGWIVPVVRGQYRIGGAPPTWEQRVGAAVAAAGHGAAASGLTAARILSIEGIESETIEVVIPHHRRAHVRGIRVHRSRIVRPIDVAWGANGIRTTRPVLTIIRLAAVLDRDRLEDAMDDLVRRGLLLPAAALRRIDGVTGLTGLGPLRELLRERCDRKPGGSSKENDLIRLLSRAGMPPVPQFEVFDGRRFVARVDGAYPDVLLAVESDGYVAHSGRRRRERDMDREAELESLGWCVLRFPSSAPAQQPDRVLSLVRATLGRRRGLLQR